MPRSTASKPDLCCCRRERPPFCDCVRLRNALVLRRRRPARTFTPIESANTAAKQCASRSVLSGLGRV